MKKIILLSILCMAILSLSNYSGFCESDYIIVKKVEILTGPTIIENGVVYIQEDQSYLVRLELVFPPLPEKTFEVKSYLHGFINIIERNIRSRSGEAAFESKIIAETLTIELEGIAPKAIVDVEGVKTTKADDRKIKGEMEFNFFEIYVDEILMHLKYEEDVQVVLSSKEILDAKEKIRQAEEAITKIELCDVSNLYLTKSLTERMRNLLEIAKNCLAEGAPIEALELADECLELAKMPITKDQIQALNVLQGSIDVDVAESSRFAHLALQEINEVEEENNFDGCLLHIEKSEEYYNKSSECLITEINKAVAKYEINPITFILMIVAFTALILLLTFLMIYQRGKKKTFDLGIEEGKRKAAEEEVTVEDIILGKNKGE